MAFFIWIAATLLGWTWRVTIDDPYKSRPVRQHTGSGIFSFWHAHLLGISFIFRNHGVTAIVSGSRDGLLAARIAGLWRHDVIAGSSSRGGTDALRKSLRVLNRKGYIGITPDGPRGPRHCVKPGVASMAVMAQVPVTILTLSSNRYWQLRSWDGFIIPKPFARVTVHVHEPILPPPAESGGDAVESFRIHIEKEMQC